MASQRIHWIDATKGLLILLMVLGHIGNIAGSKGIDNTFLTKSMFFSSLYTCFFMQAFIMLSGYTSNFEKDFISFSKSLFKSIFIPWFSFSTICLLFRIILDGGGIFYIINGQKYFFLFEDFWFLHVIFFGKLAYYVIYKYIKRDEVRSSLLLLMMICGFTIFATHSDTSNTYHYNNFLHYKDFLCMTFFIWFGNYCRRKDLFNKIHGKVFWAALILFVLGHVIRYVFRMKGINELLVAPVIISHGGNAISPLQIPAYLFFVILGSLSCFGIMQYVNKSHLLEYIGRNSLTIYCIHSIFIELYVLLINMFITPLSMGSAYIFIIITLLLVMLSCCGVVILTKYKPFSYLIGKF